MGILTNLLQTAWTQENERRNEEMNRYSTIAQIPGIRPEIQNWAIDQLTQLAPKKAGGIKDIGHMFKQLIAGQRGGDQPGQTGLQQAVASTGRPGMAAPIPAGPGEAVGEISGQAGAPGPGGAPGAPAVPTRLPGGSLSAALPAEQRQIGPVAPSMMLSPQEQLNLKLDEFKRTEGIRNDLQLQYQKFLDDQKAEQQKKQDEQEFQTLNDRIRQFQAGGYDKTQAVDMAYASMGRTAPIRAGTTAVSGLVLGSDPQLQTWGRQTGTTVDPTKQYHVMRDAEGKITQALEGPAAGRAGGLKGALGELADAQAIVDEGVGGKNKYTASEVKAAKDFITKYNRPPTTSINIGERKKTAEDIGDAIMRGDQPPILTGMGMGGAAELRAYLGKKGFNLTRAMEDWQGMTRYIASLNSSQQLRLRQASDFAFESLDLLDNRDNPGNDLIGQLRRFIPRGKYPLLNRAALKAAKEGVFGDAASSAATQLESQVTDLQSELATVYKGGNSPTDIGLKQAGSMLSGDWSENTLRDAIDLSRKNLRYRLNSIRNTGPAGVSGANLYAQPTTPEAVERTPVTRAAGAGPKFPPPRPGAKLDTGTAQKYLNAYGGDKRLAFEAAKRDGWRP